MPKRVADIAKELGVSPRVIVDKCLAEGIPPEKISGPASMVPAKLEAVIRVWLSEPGDGLDECGLVKK